MFTIIGTWPLWAQLGIGSLAIIAMAWVSRFGNLVWNKGKLSLGGGKKRSCGDCIVILFSKGKKHEVDRNKFLDRILKDQMNFVEQKIIEIQLKTFQSFRKDVLEFGTEIDHAEKEKQYKQYCETLKNALEIGKNEVRRSFKENGFHSLSGLEYSNYVKDKTQTLISMVKTYLIDHYPHERMVVTLDHRFANLDERMIEDEIFEVFNKAKEVRNEAEAKVAELDEGFKKDIDSYAEKQCN